LPVEGSGALNTKQEPLPSFYFPVRIPCLKKSTLYISPVANEALVDAIKINALKGVIVKRFRLFRSFRRNSLYSGSYRKKMSEHKKIDMFLDYQQAVIETYQRKKASNDLSPFLIHPTPANIRDACLSLIKNGIKKKDENILNGFVEARADRAGYVQAFENCDIDKFRPLVNFLKNPRINTAKINVELLAFLIDHEPRPWVLGTTYPVRESAAATEGEERIVKDETEVVLLGTSVPAKEAEPSVRKGQGKKRKFLIVMGIAALCVCGYYIGDTTFRGNESCMYWSEDHFEKISCNEKVPNTTMIAFDEYRFNNFKKIMRPDTLDYTAIGKVWYAKSKGKYEFFTSDGIHPVNPNLELKRITDYIISKVILKDSLYPK
jgi:hypothetical protein